MEISEQFNSHPKKPYNSHIGNINNSFSDDLDHIETSSYHDIAKLADKFQKYINLEVKDFESKEEFKKAREKLKTTHTLESAFIYFFIKENKNINFLANFFSILKHHSDLPDILEFIKGYLSVINFKDSINQKVQTSQDICKIAKIDANINIRSFMKYFLALERNFKQFQNLDNFFIFKKRYSRLILADKFEAIFSKPYSNVDILSKEKIDFYLYKISQIINEKQKKDTNNYKTKAREVIFKNFKNNTEKDKFLIKAPTGIGKTFLALSLALEISKIKGNKRRIITAIPFTSIIDQTHYVYENVIGKDSVLKYHHLTKYTQKSINYSEEDEKEQFSQKIFLADIWQENFIVTTFNQLFYIFFSNHNRDNLKLETLRDSVIIIDEIQNIPRVLLKPISIAFNEFAKRYNIHFIIMSATMPHIQAELENFTELSVPEFYSQKQDRYKLIYRSNLSDFENLKDEILKNKNRNVLCVVNTIFKAKKLYEMIKKEIENKANIYLLTTHQIPLHRIELINEIRLKLRNDKDKIILISTQLIEAGVDLSFDVGFREFAPFGAIIQTAGRVNREGVNKISDVIVFDCLDNNSLPYHNTDLQENKMKEILFSDIKESQIYDVLEGYFNNTKYETTSINLLDYAKNLDFQTLFTKFNCNFMPNQPWKVSLFIEQEEGQFNKFLDNREAILQAYDDKFEAIARIKDLEKDLGLYTISVSENLISQIKCNIREMFGRYILPPSDFYNKKDGFLPELTVIEEAFM